MQRQLTLAERLLKGKIQLQKKFPFFGYLLVKLPLKKMPETMQKLGPIGTDGWVIAYDPKSEFLAGLSDGDIEFVLCHEVLHCALDHIKGKGRVGGRDQILWNVAADFVVNGILCDSGLSKPSVALYKQEYSRKCVEEVYELLKQRSKKRKSGGKGKPSQGSSSEGSLGAPSRTEDGRSKLGDMETLDVHYEPGSQSKGKGRGKEGGKGKDKSGTNGRVSDAELEKHRDEWARAFASAAEWAKQQGKLPAGIARLVDELLTKSASWTVMLRRFLETVAGYDDFTYARPSRRSWAVGYYVPERRADKIEVAVAIDTSGSISPMILKDFLSEIEAFRDKFPRAHLTIYPIDAKVYEAFEVGEDDDLVENCNEFLKGGGGTDFRPLFEMFDTDERPPKCLIFLTDGWAYYPDANQEPDYYTLWLVISPLESNNTPPFGEVVEIMAGDYDE